MPFIVNIINFIRGVEPRLPMDLVEPVRQQVALLNRLDLPGTFLFQYDALVDETYRQLVDPNRFEAGLWLELVQPLVEKAGVRWRGRYSWDWHADVAFNIGYTPDERRRIIDVAMEDFRSYFGRYPASVGAWLLDAHSLAYMKERYDIAASCICKDQIGTDGYTLWGGYWNQGYYPSKVNGFIPAQSADGQIDVPVFRMLGSDPIDQYELGLGTDEQKVASLEPVYEAGGGNPGWIDWFFREMRRPTLGFGYAQVGQENSFGWPRMEAGLTYQCEQLARWKGSADVRIQTLEETGRWFRETYPLTPATTVTVLDDYEKKHRRTAWYNGRNYRTNILWDDRHVRVRDIHLFRQDYAERYLNVPVTSAKSVFDALPFVDGFSWSSADERANLVMVDANDPHQQLQLAAEPTVLVDDSQTLLAIDCSFQGGGQVQIRATGTRLEWIGSNGLNWALVLQCAAGRKAAIEGVQGKRIICRHQGFAYAVDVGQGRATWDGSRQRMMLMPVDGAVRLQMDHI